MKSDRREKMVFWKSKCKQMCFESRFKNWKGVNVTKVCGERLPELGRRAVEGTAPYGDHTGRRGGKLKGRRPERAGGRVYMEEIRKIRGCRLWSALNI